MNAVQRATATGDGLDIPRAEWCEKHILAAMAYSRTVAESVRQLSLPKDAFFYHDNQRLYECLCAPEMAWVEAGHIDAGTLFDRVCRQLGHDWRVVNDALQKAMEYRWQIDAPVPEVLGWVNELIEAYRRRKLRSELYSLAEDFSSLDTNEALAEVTRLQEDIQRTLSGGMFLSPREGAITLEIPRGVPTGFDRLDDLLLSSGYGDGTYNILAGRTSTGKTTMALQIVRNVCRSGGTVVYYSLEMDRDRIRRKMAMMLAGISVDDLKRGLVDRRQYDAFREATEEIKGWAWYLTDVTDRNIEEIEADLSRFEAVNGRPHLAVIDHCGLITPLNPRWGIYEKTVEHSRRLKNLAQRSRVALLNLVQINRQGDMNERIEMRHLEGGGVLEQDADTILLLQKREGEPGGAYFDTVVTLDKNRDAHVGWFRLRFLTDFGWFVEPSTDEAVRERREVCGRGYWQPEKRKKVMADTEV